MLDVDVKFQPVRIVNKQSPAYFDTKPAAVVKDLTRLLGGSLAKKLRLQISPNDSVVHLAPIILARVGDLSPFKFIKSE